MDRPSPPVQDRILDAARQLFLTRGYNGSNLRDIAKEAKVSMGGIYHHFGSKEDIYKALLRHTALLEEIPKVAMLFRQPEFPENLGAIGEAIFRLVRANKDYFKLLYIDVLEFQGANVMPLIAGLRDLVAKQSGDFLAHREDLVDAPPALMMRVMIDVFLHYYLEEVMLEKSLSADLGVSDEVLADRMANLILYGIMRRP